MRMLWVTLATVVAFAAWPQAAAARESDSCADPQTASTVAKPEPSARTVLFDQFIQPLLSESTRRRASWVAEDPRYSGRVNDDLNAHRLNVVLLGYGEEHEQTYDDMGVSITILSLDLETWDVTSISLSRDIRAPELEVQSVQAPPRWPITLRAAYRSGGFDRVRRVIEDATGLAVDFEVLMKDVLLRNYLDTVSGPVELIVPKDFSTNAYRLDGVEHQPDFIAAGRQSLSADRAMTFVLGESLDPMGKADERSYRKDLLLRTLFCQARQRFTAKEPGFLLSLARFSLSELANQDLLSDFNFGLVNGGLITMAQAFVISGGQADATFPSLGSGHELVIHDEAFGDGGVRRVHYMAESPDEHGIPDDPLVKQEIAMGSLAPYMLIPIGGNPYAADLANDYWRPVRNLIRTRLAPAT